MSGSDTGKISSTLFESLNTSSGDFFCLLAAGHIDVALDAGLQSYDIAPLVPIIEAAGGIVTTWDGEPATVGGNIIAAASRQLYEEALSLLP